MEKIMAKGKKGKSSGGLFVRKDVKSLDNRSTASSAADDKVRSKFTMKNEIACRIPGKKLELSSIKFKTSNKVSSLEKNKNELSSHFDAHNGDFDTPEEFIRAYLHNDARAIRSLNVKYVGRLKDTLDEFYPELKEMSLDGIDSPAEMKSFMDEMVKKINYKPQP